MILNTHPTNRKDMVKVISELTDQEVLYKFLPTYAYEIGPITVNKDGTISCDDMNCIALIKPMLIERGWLDEIPAEQQNMQAETNEGEETTEPAADRHMEMSMPLRSWEGWQLNSLLRILYTRQRLINRMMQSDMLFIEESFIQSLLDNPVCSYNEFESRLNYGISTGAVRGISYNEGKFSLHAPSSQSESTRWVAFSELLGGILKYARATKHVHLHINDDPENEKYHANTWLMRMGFAGSRHKEMRRILMQHLNGFAAFKNANAMQRHKDKYAQLRREKKEEAQ